MSDFESGLSARSDDARGRGGRPPKLDSKGIVLMLMMYYRHYYFGSTSSEEHHALTKEVFSKIESNGYIYEDTIKQFYSHEDGRFLPDRYIEGECPKCHYKDARGDQCDGCGTLLDPEDLIEPRSTISGSKNIEVKKRDIYF